MRIFPVAAVITLGLILGEVASGIAQTWPNAWPTRGYFGNRALGQPMSTIAAGASPSIVGDRVLGQTLRPGPMRFSTPIPLAPAPQVLGMLPYGNGWYPIVAQPAATALAPYGVAPAANATVGADQLAPMGAVQPTMYTPAAQTPRALGTAPTPFATQDAASATAQAAAQAAGQAAVPAATGTGPSLPGPHRWPGSAIGTTQALVGPLVPLPEVSARVTRLARAGRVYTPTGITVSLANGTAVVQGTVGSPADRALISNLVAMERGIWQVDNRLTVLGERPAAGSAKRQ